MISGLITSLEFSDLTGGRSYLVLKKNLKNFLELIISKNL